MNDNEVWKAIAGCEGKYEVSSRGRVRNTKTGRVLKGALLKTGYHYICLYNRGYLRFYIHHLVANAFLGGCPEGSVVTHIDKNRANNCMDNLEFITHQEHTLRAWETARENGTDDRVGTPELYAAIEELGKTGANPSYHELNERFGITNVNRIIKASRKNDQRNGRKPIIKKNAPHPMKKLTRETLAEIRVWLANGQHTQQSIADVYGIHPSLVTRIKQGKRHADK